MKNYALTVGFDKNSSDMIQKTTDRIAEITGNSYMLDIGIEPHISLGLFCSENEEDIVRATDDLVRSIHPFDVQFESIGTFSPYVVFVSPVKDEILTKYNKLTYERFVHDFPLGDDKNYHPDTWVPHCSLAVRLDEKQNAAAMEEAGRLRLPIKARAKILTLAECNPYTVIKVWELK